MMTVAALSFNVRTCWKTSNAAVLACLLASFDAFRLGAEESGAAPKPQIHAAVRLNTVGYLPSAPKLATLTNVDDGAEFVVRHADTGKEAFRGRATRIDPVADANSGVCIADFSELRRPGTYKLTVDGADDAIGFSIADDVYNWPFYCATRAMYLARCGTAVEGDFAGQTFHHAACHLQDGLRDHAGTGSTGRVDGIGGWHDAGDYNKYTVNAAFTLGMMMQAWEHFEERLTNVELNIPEAGNDIPDYLDEIRWELNWLLKMQADDGRVYHKLSALQFNEFEPPEEESEPRYFSPWSSAATADFIAVMAQAARVFRPFDAAFSDRCLAAAITSYDALEKHPGEQQPDQSKFSTGEYRTGDRDDRFWAAAELWETTGKPEYLIDCERRLRAYSSGEVAATLVDSDWDWANVRNLGTFTYLLSKRTGQNPQLVAKAREDALRSADALVGVAGRDVDGRPLGVRYYWGCNGTVARLAINLHVAQRLTGEAHFRDTMLDSLNYIFGRNPYGRSFVTGLGYRPPMFPHDRRCGGDEVKLPWPGYLVGGPWPTADDWRDDQEDYRTNEIAINWNGALIYALAAFVEPESFNASVAAAERSLSQTAAGK